MKNQKMYWVQKEHNKDYSMVGFVMWTPQKQFAKKYTLEEANKLIAEIPPHLGKGVLVEYV